MADNDLQLNLQQIREGFYKIASKHYQRLSDQQMKKLMNLKFDLETFDDVNLPDVDEIHVLSDSDIKKFKDKLRKRIKLIEILQRKNNCSISKIIDEI